MNLTNKLIILSFLILTIACNNNDVQINERTQNKLNDRNGEYFGLNSPGDSSQVFAPDFISTSLSLSNSLWSVRNFFVKFFNNT